MKTNSVFNAKHLAWLLSSVIKAHERSLKGVGFRRHDKKTPYGVHPCLAALLMMSEPVLDEQNRETGAKVLAFHDIPEETGNKPETTDTEVLRLVGEMTFANSAEEMEMIWQKEPFVLLLKLYDKFTNLLDGSWMKPEKARKYKEYVVKLAAEVEKTYPGLQITLLARALCAQ